MRVATWFVGAHRTSEPRRRRQREHVARADADVVVLTGAVTSLVPAGHDVHTTADEDGHGVHDVVLSARRVQPLPLPELRTAVAAVVDDDRLVVGVRLDAGERDLRSLDRALDRLRREHPGLPAVLVGGFGQTLTGHVVGSRVGRVLLTGVLHRSGLVAHTASAPSARAGCAAVDHVCSTTAAAHASTWSSVDAEAELVLTDSLGYVVDL